jgi:hypothetical protein
MSYDLVRELSRCLAKPVRCEKRFSYNFLAYCSEDLLSLI